MSSKHQLFAVTLFCFCLFFITTTAETQVPSSPSTSTVAITQSAPIGSTVGVPVAGALNGNNPSVPNPSQVVVHIVSENNERVPELPPVPVGNTFKPFQATALGGSDGMQVFQAAPLLTSPQQRGFGGGVGAMQQAIQVLTNAASLGGESAPIGTLDNVRILDMCGDDPCKPKTDKGEELEKKLDAVKETIAEQSRQIQNNNDYVRKTQDLIKEYTNKQALVQQHADKLKAEIRMLFEKRSRLESVLLRLRMKEAVDVKAASQSKGEVYSAIVEGYRCKEQKTCQ